MGKYDINTYICTMQENNGRFKTRHGLSRTPLYKKWYGMKSRCYNPNVRNYNNWGGRGITICDEWKDDFLQFYEWSINNGYKDGLSLDRTNNNGNYTPTNCRFITLAEQQGNKRPKRSGLRYKTSKSKYIGVCFDNQRNKWRGMITILGVKISTKRFKTELEAFNELNKKIKEHDL